MLVLQSSFSDARLYGGVNHKEPEDLELQSSNFDAWPYGANLLLSKPLRFPRVCQWKKCECQFTSDHLRCQQLFLVKRVFVFFLYNDRATLRGVSVFRRTFIYVYMYVHIYTYIYIYTRLPCIALSRANFWVTVLFFVRSLR